MDRGVAQRSSTHPSHAAARRELRVPGIRRRARRESGLHRLEFGEHFRSPGQSEESAFGTLSADKCRRPQNSACVYALPWEDAFARSLHGLQ